MRLKAIVHEAAEGGFWAEIPAMPGCCAQGGTREELLENLKEAAQGCLLCERGDGFEDIPGESGDDLTIEVGG